MANTQQFAGKVAVITGGSRGIGNAVATALVERGAKVVLGDILESEGQAAAQELNAGANSKVAAFIRTDVTKYRDNIALFQLAEKEFGGVDIAFLNAGIAEQNNLFAPLDDEADERLPDINLMSVIKGTKVALMHMGRGRGGVIVNTASIHAMYADTYVSSYSAAKHGVAGWTRSLYLLPEVCNVRVNSVCPYYAETAILGFPPEMKSMPHVELISKLPRVSVKTVVKATLMLMEDESRNAELLLALPGDVIRPHPMPEPMAEAATPEAEQAKKVYQKAYPEFLKAQLAEAIKNYDRQYGSN